MRYILTADIGTTALKTALYGEDGQLLSSRSREYSFRTPEAGWAEMPAEEYTEAFASAIRDVMRDAAVSAEDISVLGLSTQGETMLLLDGENRPLRPAILWCDTRAAGEAKDIADRFGSRCIQEHTGQVGADAIWPGAKLLWVRRHEPQVFRAMRHTVQLEGWFSYLLTGKFAGEDSILGSSVYFDIRSRQYWPEMLDFLDIRADQLPEIVLPGAVTGFITEEAAERFGLSSRTSFCIGGIDLACGAVGVGNVRPGSFSDVTGSSLCTMTMTDRIVLDPAGEMPCYCSAIPGLYMIHAYASGGICLRWMRDLFSGGNTGSALPGCSGAESDRPGFGNAYDRMDTLAAACPPGAEGLIALPHLMGSGPPDLCPEMKGALLGLTPGHTEAHMIRAFMEGVAMVLCRILDATGSLGLPPDRIVCLGGGAKSSIWCQIKADAAGLPVLTTDGYENACCLGAAILAGTGAGLFPGIEEAVDALVREDRVYRPNPDMTDFYRTLRARYDELMKCLLPAFREKETGQP